MNKISVDGITPKIKRFHNEEIEVFEKELSIDDIKFWHENARTLFTLEKLEKQENKALAEISTNDVVRFVVNEDLHKISDLKKSILDNGVKVPLIVLDDGTLLDGNRRFFACYSIKLDCINSTPPKAYPNQIQKIPAYIIKSIKLSETQKIKIIAEENFLPELKLPWSLDAQARVVENYLSSLKSNNPEFDDDDAIENVAELFGISRSRVKDLILSLKLVDEFVNNESLEQNKIARRSIAEDKFVYFWEFINKATKGNKKYTDPQELDVVKDVFFKFMSMPESPIKNVKQIEPIAQAKRDKIAWEMLCEDRGSKLSLVVSIMNDKKETRKAEDKIRAFFAWLEPITELSDSAKNNLEKLSNLITTKI